MGVFHASGMAAKNAADWRPSGGDVADFQNEARKEDLFTDIQFLIGKGTSCRQFRAHKLILACGSPVFEKMFYGEMAEKGSVINIEEDDPEAFEMLLSYLYGKGDSLKIASFIRAWKFYIIGDKYLVAGIQDKAKEFISSTTMTEYAFWEIVENEIFSCDILKDEVFFFIQKNAYTLTVSENFLNMPEAIINTILKMDKINITEYKILTSVTKWAYHYIGSDTNSKDLLKFFQYIRFSVLTTEEFFQFIEIFPCAVDAQSSLDILKHLNHKSINKLPHWCSTNNMFRNVEFQVQKRQKVIYLSVNDWGL